MRNLANFKELGGHLGELGSVLLPGVVYGKEIVDKSVALVTGTNPSFDVAWVAGIIGTSVVGSWVGAKLEAMRSPK